MAKARKRKRKTVGLRDAGPGTRRYQAIRDGIQGMSKALDRGACKDAMALMKLTERAMRNVPILRAEREFFEDERERFATSCKTASDEPIVTEGLWRKRWRVRK